jgi:nucleotide-binding universal stress UspA family protein
MAEESAAQWSPSEDTGFELGTDGPRVIMVGIDDSPASWRAAAYAGGLARRQNALLALVYVQPNMMVADAYGVAIAEATAQIAEQLKNQIEAQIERLRGVFHVRWTFLTTTGDPYHGLVAVAEQLKADSVVVGASERYGMRVVGSVAVRLVKAGRWPVTVVP